MDDKKPTKGMNSSWKLQVRDPGGQYTQESNNKQPWNTNLPKLTKSNNDNISNVHTTDAFSKYFSISFTLNLSIPRSQTYAIVTLHK